MEILLWLCLIVVIYTFVGYGFLLYIIIRVKRIFKGKPAEMAINEALLPTCTLVVAAYNEAYFMPSKIENTMKLKYPEGKLKLLFITDGSDDGTPDIIAKYPQIGLMHEPARNGKIMAIHRAMKNVNSEITVFTDANTFLNEDAILNICRHYADQTVGAVAGEKRVQVDDNADASAAGEGFYWKYESTLKKWDSELYSVVGAAGELFSVRTSLYKPVQNDAILDDFMISMLIAMQGYRIVYDPTAYALEGSSANVTEELKRKIRIAAGGIQSIVWLKKLLNPFHYPLLSFQYISHRVLRWTVTPYLLILAFILNIFLALTGSTFYVLLLIAQIMFYGMAVLGWIMEMRELRVKILFIPYYFCIMNYAVMMGIIRYFKKSQSAAWEKSARKV
jgi:biofilm PGA synthesis N-glycosyltransferase PgaC